MDDQRLEKLKQLRESGALNEEEFQLQKEKLSESASHNDFQYEERIKSDNSWVPPDGEESSLDRKSAFSTIGLVLFFAGLFVVIYAGWVYDASVSSSPDVTGRTIEEITESALRAIEMRDARVYNTGLLNRQLVIALLGMGLMICGSVMFSASKIVDAIRGR